MIFQKFIRHKQDINKTQQDTFKTQQDTFYFFMCLVNFSSIHAGFKDFTRHIAKKMCLAEKWLVYAVFRELQDTRHIFSPIPLFFTIYYTPLYSLIYSLTYVCLYSLKVFIYKK